MSGMHTPFLVSQPRSSCGWGRCREGAASRAVMINLSLDIQLGKCHENTRERRLAGPAPPGWKDPLIYHPGLMLLASQCTSDPLTG